MPNGLALAILLLVIMLFWAYIISIFLNFLTPYYSTNRKILKELIKNFNLKPTDKFADLGSGDGRVLFETYKQYKCEVTGYEISPMILLWFKIKKLFKHPYNSKIIVQEQSFFKTDLSKYNVIYCCLPEDLLEILSEKFNKELKEGTKVYTLKKKLKDKKGKKIEIADEVVYQYTF